MERLPEEVKSKWVAALRSGEWQQGTGELNDGFGGFCCLGVLAEVLEPGVTKEGGQLHDMCTLHEVHSDEYGYETSFVKRHKLRALFTANLELKAMADKHRSKEANEVADASIDTSLMCLNDDGRFSFKKLADLIEEYL